MSCRRASDATASCAPCAFVHRVRCRTIRVWFRGAPVAANGTAVKKAALGGSMIEWRARATRVRDRMLGWVRLAPDGGG